jgi:hypothetical protein
VQSTADRQFKSARPDQFFSSVYNFKIAFSRVSGERRRKALRGEPCKARPSGSSNLPVPTNQNPAKIKDFCRLPRSGPGGRPPGFAMRKAAIFGFFGGARGGKENPFATSSLIISTTTGVVFLVMRK